jgi:NAD(P)-dependent dehydrogenase (short-subunit alcohol dehydrogenase family)
MKSVAFITGTSTGIGQATAIAMAQAGYTVVATMRDLKKGESLRTLAQEQDLPIHLQTCDVCNEEQCRQAIQETITKHGRLDIVINNAGAGYLGTTEQTSLADFQWVFDVNFFGVVRVTKAALPILRSQGSGKIITVTSVGGVVGQPFNDAYCAAKFAVEGMMESLAPVAKQFGVQVSLVEPGAVASEFRNSAREISASRLEAREDPYIKLLDGYVKRITGSYSSAQTSEQVAEVIVNVAQSANPKLHVASSEAALGFMKIKLNDASGDALLAFTESWIKLYLNATSALEFRKFYGKTIPCPITLGPRSYAEKKFLPGVWVPAIGTTKHGCYLNAFIQTKANGASGIGNASTPSARSRNYQIQ